MKLHTVIARVRLWRKIPVTWQSNFSRVSIFFSLAILVGIFSPSVLADSKTDYDYQYGIYRQSYSEYAVLKKDYLETSSLDNQQKAMLSAKQALLSRDLAKSSLAWYVWDLIDSSKVNYPPTKTIFDSLADARQFFLGESEKSKKIITTENLKQFTKEYQTSVSQYDKIIRYGIVANKIVRLVRIQTDAQTAFDDLLPNLPSPAPTTVTARIEELKALHAAINDSIDVLAANLQPAEGDENVDAEIFYSVRIEKMKEIIAMQTNWINRLIDLDQNYVHSKN